MGVLREREVQLYMVCRVLPGKNQWVEEAPLSRVVDYHLQAEAPCCCTRRPHCFCKIQLVIFTPSLPLSHFHSSRTKENPDQYICNFTLPPPSTSLTALWPLRGPRLCSESESRRLSPWFETFLSPIGSAFHWSSMTSVCLQRHKNISL